MKKVLIKSLIVSLLIIAVCMGSDLLTFWAGSMFPAIRIPGGDCVEYVGVGIYGLTIVPETRADAPIKTINRVSFSPQGFAVCLLTVFAVIFTINFIRYRKTCSRRSARR